MRYLAEQHLQFAKLLRAKAALFRGSEREERIKSSNQFVSLAARAAQHRGGISLANFDWNALVPDWSIIDDQMFGLAPADIEGPGLVPNTDSGPES